MSVSAGTNLQLRHSIDDGNVRRGKTKDVSEAYKPLNESDVCVDKMWQWGSKVRENFKYLRDV